jgi:YidC/Oxa1 family membrane protein insertase
MWDAFVDLLRASIFATAHLCGGSLGGGVLLVSAGVRLALLPLTLRLARRARQQQARIAALRPQVEALQLRFAKDPRGLMRETQALYAEHDIRLFTPASVAGIAIQIPLLSGVFAAVRRGLGTKVGFLWVPDLTRPDSALLLGVVALTAWGASSAPAAPGQAGTPNALVGIMVIGTAIFLWSASSAVALSMGAGSLVTLLQNWLLSRDARPDDAPARA